MSTGFEVGALKGRWLALARHCIGVLMLLAAAGSWAQTCGVPGITGFRAATTGVLNSYHGGSGSPAAGATSITVASIAGSRTNTRSLLVGDMILIMQMQDSASGAAAGTHEYAIIEAISGTTLTLNRALSNSYTQSMNTGSVRNWQVVWVPQYSSLSVAAGISISADRWTSNTTTGVATGGVVAIDVAGAMTMAGGTITAAGSGFRGAFGMRGSANNGSGTSTTANSNFTPTSATTVYGGQKGEGIQGTPPVVFQGTAIPATYSTLLGQGYASGAGGQQAIGNAGGAANDGVPTTSSNSFNSGGGGGGNAGAGGQGGNSWNSGNGGVAEQNQGTNTNIGNVAGGKGGNAQTNSSGRLVMGGGGGSGSANNGTGGDTISNWPPTASSSAANGADGAVASSGASGGGVVLIRAGSFAASAAAVIDASGYRAYNKSPVADTDASGGGGGGGSIYFTAGSGSLANVTLLASGGAGGSSNYYQHGPGGGGGGGYVLTNLSGGTINVNGAPSGTDGCCGGTTGTGTSTWNAAAGSNGASSTSASAATGVQGGASCLPVITVTKSTLTPTLTSAATGATASYVINLSNSGGAATNVFMMDNRLPAGWAYSSASAPTLTYSPSPGAGGANADAAGAENTSASAPTTVPVSSLGTVNTGTAVTLRAAATAPGVMPTTGAVSPTFGSFYLPQNGSITLNFVVTIPTTSTAGTYHNPAGVIFLDPTRQSGTPTRMVTPLANANANRQTQNYAGTSYISGSTTSVQGSNYSGLVAGPATEDVALIPEFSVTKSASASSTPGKTINYIITPRNNGWGIATITFAATQGTDITTANLPTQVASNPLTVTDTLPTGVTSSAAFTGTGWVCTGGATQVCTRSAANAYPIAASTNYPVITGTVTVTAVCTGATPITNTATISTAVGEPFTANNIGTATTTISCPNTANLQISKTNNVTVLVTNQTVAYTITVTNSGPQAATATMVQDTPTAGLSCGSTNVTCTGFSGALCPASSMPFGSLTAGVAIPTFPAGSSATFVVTCGVTATGL